MGLYRQPLAFTHVNPHDIAHSPLGAARRPPINRLAHQLADGLLTHPVYTRGLKLLAKSKTVQRRGKLSLAQQLESLYIIQYQSPNDFGYYQNIFTAEVLIGQWGR